MDDQASAPETDVNTNNHKNKGSQRLYTFWIILHLLQVWWNFQDKRSF
jgi:hypothetical protein